MMVVLFAATGVVVAGVLALTLQSWWVLVAVLIVHAVATTAVVFTRCNVPARAVRSRIP